MPGKPKKTTISDAKETSVPVFNTDALSTLTQKIESNLKKQINEKVPKSTTAKSKVKRNKKKEGNEIASSEVPTPTASANASNGKAQALGTKKPTEAPKSSRGQKRLRDGTTKELNHTKREENVNGIKLGTRAPKPAGGGDLEIDQDIRALGGTRDDIDMVANVPSDSEIEGDDTAAGEVQKELQQLIRQLGVDKLPKREMLEDAISDQEYGTPQELQRPEQEGKAASKQTNGKTLISPATKTPGKGQASLAIKTQTDWHAIDLPVIPAPSSHKITALPSGLVDRLHEHAKSLLEKENEQYAAHDASASSSRQFYATIMSSGTLSDKISALTLSVQESPIHNMKALENLVGLARKRSRSQAIDVLGALKDLFGLGNLLPSDRKLRNFKLQPSLSAIFDPTDLQWTSKDPLPRNLQNCHLISWAYEDWLKTIYFDILKIMETWCNDEVVFARGRAVDYVCQLLKEKPEQEANLLRLLVNKLGDSDKKIASKTSFHILQLETTHPLMKPTIIAAIESDLLFRSTQSLHAKYYATITLNQTVLSGKEEGVARKLLDIYFSLFIKLFEKPDTTKPAAAEVNKVTINKKGDVQGGGGAGGKKAIKKMAEKEKATTVDEELREKMLSAVLTGVNRAIPFINTNDESFEKHLDTLFKVTHSSNFNTSIQALMLIQQLNGSHQGSVDRFYRTLYESLLDPRLLTSSKQALYLNLLFRALRPDLNVKRVKAFAKRLLQVIAMHQPSFACGTLYLLRELEGVSATLVAFIDQAEEESDDEENFKDVQEAKMDAESTSKDEVRTVDTLVARAQKPTRYDGRKRDPEHCNADQSSLWELTPFLQHYHPSVSLFATRLLMHNAMPPKPDLSLNTLSHFLDRFVYRNPKANKALKGASIMQPMAGGDSSALLVSAYSNKDSRRQPVNSEAFWKQDTSKVGADEVFFHKYFSTLGRGKEKAKKRKADKKKDEERSESEGDEDEIWKALVVSRPELDEGSDGGIFSDDNLGSEMEDSADEGNNLRLDKEANDLEDAAGTDDSLGLEEDDDEALVGSDEQVPSDLEAAFEAELQTNGTSKALLSGASDQGEKRSTKRRRLKNLPTFASADDYAKMLEEAD